VRFWCGFQITRPADNVLIAQCRQMLALIEMPEGKLLRLPEHLEKYRSNDSAEFEREDRIPISGKEPIQ
jgi:acyl-CoA thioesterase FadM